MIRIILLFIIISVSGCAKLDNNLFNNDKITEYRRDNYTGEQDFILDDSYKISDNLITQLVLNSQAPDESAPTKIYTVYIGNISEIATDTVIMYCHGNKWHMDFYWQRAKLLANTGEKNRYGVMMVDYRGYGLSDGKPDEKGLYADVEAGLNWLKSKGLTGDRLIMYGFSMGSAPATELTANPRSLVPSKLILEAPFASAEVMVQDATILAVPASFVTDLKIDNAEEIKKVTQPFLWIHGTKDDFLSISTHGEVVFRNYKGQKGTAVRVEGAGHGTVQTTLGFPVYTKIIEEFITAK